MKIRAATEKDIPALGRLFGQVAEFHVRNAPAVFQMPPNDWIEAFFRDGLKNPEVILLVAEVEGEVVGEILAESKKSPNHPLFVAAPDFLQISDLVVDVDHRGRGIGKKLIAAVEAEAKRRGFSEILLGVWSFNVNAINLYAGLGYEVTRSSMIKKL